MNEFQPLAPDSPQLYRNPFTFHFSTILASYLTRRIGRTQLTTLGSPPDLGNNIHVILDAERGQWHTFFSQFLGRKICGTLYMDEIALTEGSNTYYITHIRNISDHISPVLSTIRCLEHDPFGFVVEHEIIYGEVIVRWSHIGLPHIHSYNGPMHPIPVQLTWREYYQEHYQYIRGIPFNYSGGQLATEDG